MLVKFLMVGDSAVGKTSVLTRFVDATFSTRFMTTIGVDYKDKEIEVDGNQLTMQIWDTAGQERFRNLTISFYRRTQGIILVYDVTSRQSFDNVQDWIREINECAGEHVCKCLFGNQADRVEDKAVSTEEGQAFATQNGMAFFEGSAKADINVAEVFAELARQVMAAWGREQELARAASQQDTVQLTAVQQRAPGKKKCC
jgi:Ras-related protein Rab-8A